MLGGIGVPMVCPSCPECEDTLERQTELARFKAIMVSSKSSIQNKLQNQKHLIGSESYQAPDVVEGAVAVILLANVLFGKRPVELCVPCCSWVALLSCRHWRGDTRKHLDMQPKPVALVLYVIKLVVQPRMYVLTVP